MKQPVRRNMILALAVISIFGLMGMDLLEAYEEVEPSQRETLLKMVADGDARTLQSLFPPAEPFSLTEAVDTPHEETLEIVGVYPMPNSVLREDMVLSLIHI